MSDSSLQIDKKSRDSRADAVCLAMVSGVGPQLYAQLIESFGNATGAMDASPAQLRELPGVGTTLATRIARAREEIEVADEIQRCQQHDIVILDSADPTYPTRLLEIHDPPSLLFCKGPPT